MSNRLDVIIFGASGYTGRRVVQLLVEITTKENSYLKFGIAGRSLQKLQLVLMEMEQTTGRSSQNLQAVLTETEQSTGINLQEVPIIIADTKNESSLMKMASQCRLLINCTGPYKYHGEPVVRACIHHGCHYVDVTAEPQFQERIQLLYDKEAALKGVLVVPACGIDSLIADMGVNFLQKKFDGTINSIESYWEIVPDDGNYGSGSLINNGTWQSLLLVLHDYAQLKEIRSKLFKKMPNLEPKLALRRLPHKVPTSSNISVPFPGPDATVIRRSQRYFYEQHQSRPAQIHTYIAISNFLYILLAYIGFLIVTFMVRFRWFFNLLSKHPKLFTAGFLGDEPKKDETKNFLLTTTLCGLGWKGKVVDIFYKEREDAWIRVKVTGTDGYRMTAVCVVVSAIILLDKNQKLPEVGGVYTPAACFTKTNIVDLLQQNGIKFEICGQSEIKSKKS